MRVALLLLAAFTLFAVRPAVAATRRHALIIGNNGTFPAGSTAGLHSPVPLQYADDDAAAFQELVAEVVDSSELLTVMDAETQALYPSLAAFARVPTREAVRGAVGRIRKRIDEQRANGDRIVVLVFFSGHGAVDFEGRPALALTDGGLDQAFLYREMLEQLPAEELHVLIDACHAEAIVRPRDVEAETVNVSAAQASAFLVQNTLARFPHVGAIVAATTNAKAHEWDAIRHGIFTHELLSALRGGADVNRDRRLEYSEVYAFMTAANREVRDTRARLAIVAKPPDVNRRAALLTLSDFSRTRAAWLAGVPGRHGIVEIADFRGRRLATLHGDADFVANVLVPSDATLYVRAGGSEARFSARAGEVIAFERLKFAGSGSRERGALEDAIRRGLFAARYGRRYYEGIVDQMPGFLPVEFSDADDGDARFGGPDSLWGETAFVLAGGLSTGIADVATVTHGVNFGLRPVGSSGAALSLSAFSAYEGPLAEWQVKASAGYLWSIGHGPVHGFGGAMLAGGLLNQAVDGLPQRRTGFGGLGAVAGLSAQLSGSFGVWSELDLSAVLLRRDQQLSFAFMPAAWLGGSLRL